MTWFLHCAGRRLRLVAGAEYRVGRGADCDLVVEGERLSRVHLVVAVSPDDSGWNVEDVSSNGTYSTSGRVGALTGNDHVALALGAADGPVVVLSREHVVAPAAFERAAARSGFPPDPTAPTGTPGIGRRIRLGRDLDNDVVVPGLLASAHHALVAHEAQGWVLLDLNSARGTFVGGRRVTRATLLPGDVVSLGGSSYTFTGEGLQPRAGRGGVVVEARAITVRSGSATLLHEVSFRAEPRTVTAVIGPSGSGKSTLLNAMTGLRPAQSGQVLVDGADFYSRYDEMRFWVAAVPQADLVPAQLRVREALDYAARLRFPTETPAQVRGARVDEVLAELGLAERAGLRIDRLSGGQRKRVSVALELLTRPQILYLDEPTSGLDPGLDRQVMMLLRELADDGRTVFVVTHAVENLGLADRLIVLAAGGWLAYDGPPDGVLDHFRVADLPSVFTTLEALPGQEWAARWARQRVTRGGSGGAGLAEPRPPGPGAPEHPACGTTQQTAVAATVARPVGGWSQLPTLVARNLRVIAADPGYVGLLVLLPVILGLAGAVVGTADGLGPGTGPGGLNPEARSLLLVIALGCVFTGAATSIQELVKDRVIYQRERAVGLSRAAHVGAKALVLGAIAAVQGFVFSMLALAGRNGPSDPLVLGGHVEIALIASVSTVCAAMTALAISAVLPSREVAMPVLVVVTIVEVILSGAIPLRFDWIVDGAGWLIPAQWQFAAMASSTDLGALLGPAGGGQQWPHDVAELVAAVGVLAAMAAACLLLSIRLVGRHDPGQS